MQAFYPATGTKCYADNNKVLCSHRKLNIQEPVVPTSAEDSQRVQSLLCPQPGFRGEKRLGFLLVLSDHRLWGEPDNPRSLIVPLYLPRQTVYSTRYNWTKKIKALER